MKDPLSLRLSITSTYDSRKTGPRFHVETFVADRFVSSTPISDPFVRHTVKVSLVHAFLSFLKFGYVKVSIHLNGDPKITEDVMELDGNYIGHGSTRRSEWNTSIDKSLREFARAE